MYFLLKLLSLCRVKFTINAIAFGPLIDSLNEQKKLFHTVTHVIPTEKKLCTAFDDFSSWSSSKNFKFLWAVRLSKMLYQLVNKTLFKQIIFSYNKTLIGIDLIQHAVNYTLDSASLLIC